MNDFSSAAPTTTEPAPAFWRDRASYDELLRDSIVLPLETAVAAHGAAPVALQAAALQRLAWYFAVDLRERAPTVLVDETMAKVFHALVGRAMRCIDTTLINALKGRCGEAEVRHALLSYLSPCERTVPTVDAYDHDRGLLRITYWVHGSPVPDSFFLNGQEIVPSHAKYRACRFFRRSLYQQRIVWIPCTRGDVLAAKIDGQWANLKIEPTQWAAASRLVAEPEAKNSVDVADVLDAYPPGKHGQLPLPRGWRGWKVRLLRALARSWLARAYFHRAWVFSDRAINADDNAEHLYRWVRKNRPEVNAWFILRRDSCDWPRLKAEGFRLIQPGFLTKLLLLNADHIASSHPDFAFGGFDRSLYGSAMQWRFTYLKHGVSANDQSHFYAGMDFDLIISTTVGEHQSIVSDGSTYPYTSRVVRRLGLARFDRLAEWSRNQFEEKSDLVVVMPTWRAELGGGQLEGMTAAETAAYIANSRYIQAWRSFLNQPGLESLLARHGKKMVFFPHINAMPHLAALAIPSFIETIEPGSISIQRVLVKCSAFITDYTSVAFDAAFLRRSVFYYQFDREAFYTGGHNWRPSYFDYERDGFGPVVADSHGLLMALTQSFAAGQGPAEMYLTRINQAFPLVNDSSCARIFEAMNELRAVA